MLSVLWALVWSKSYDMVSGFPDRFWNSVGIY